MPCNFVSVLRGWVCALGQALVAGFRSFLVQFMFFSFVFHHNPWTPSSLAVIPLYSSNPSPRHLICYTCLHYFHQILAAVTNFARIVLVLSSNSDSVLKTGLVFAYELGFRHSIYQNRSEFFSLDVFAGPNELRWGRILPFFPRRSSLPPWPPSQWAHRHSMPSPIPFPSSW